jgi:hypothetical protein
VQLGFLHDLGNGTATMYEVSAGASVLPLATSKYLQPLASSTPGTSFASSSGTSWGGSVIEEILWCAKSQWSFTNFPHALFPAIASCKSDTSLQSCVREMVTR